MKNKGKLLIAANFLINHDRPRQIRQTERKIKNIRQIFKYMITTYKM